MNTHTAPTTQTTEKPLTKLDKVANALLAGKHLTGLQLLTEYGVASYRDCILILRKRGMNITTVMDKHTDGVHGRYFMTPEAIKAYNERKEVKA